MMGKSALLVLAMAAAANAMWCTAPFSVEEKNGNACPPTIPHAGYNWWQLRGYENWAGCNDCNLGYKRITDVYERSTERWNDGGWFAPSPGAHWETNSKGEYVQFNPWYIREDNWFARLFHTEYRCHDRIKIKATFTVNHETVDPYTSQGPRSYWNHPNVVGAGLIINARGNFYMACEVDTRYWQAVRMLQISNGVYRTMAYRNFQAFSNNRYTMILETDSSRSVNFPFWYSRYDPSFTRVRCSVEGKFRRRWRTYSYHTSVVLEKWYSNSWRYAPALSGTVGIFSDYSMATFHDVSVDTDGHIDTEKCCHLYGDRFIIDDDGKCRNNKHNAKCQHIWIERTERCVYDYRCDGTNCPAATGDCRLDKTYFTGFNMMGPVDRQLRFTEEECYWLAKQLGGAGFSFSRLSRRSVGRCIVREVFDVNARRFSWSKFTVIFKDDIPLQRIRDCDLQAELTEEVCTCDCELVRNCENPSFTGQANCALTDRNSDTCQCPEDIDGLGQVLRDSRCLCCFDEEELAKEQDALAQQCTANRGIWVGPAALVGSVDEAVANLLGQHDDLTQVRAVVKEYVAEYRDAGDGAPGQCVACSGLDCADTSEKCWQQGGKWYPARCYPYTIGAQGFGVSDASACEAIGKEWVVGQCYKDRGDIDCNMEVCTETSQPIDCSDEGQVWHPGLCLGQRAPVLYTEACSGTSFVDYVVWWNKCLQMDRTLGINGPEWVEGWCQNPTFASASRRLLEEHEMSLHHSDWLYQYMEEGFKDMIHPHDWVEAGHLDKPLEGRPEHLGHGGIPKVELDNVKSDIFARRKEHAMSA